MTAVDADRYPTRLAHAAAPIRRTCPVVWGTAVDGPLSPTELTDFDARGFLLRPGTVGAGTLTELRRELERLPVELAPDDPRLIREPTGGAVRSIFAPHQLSAVVAELSCHPEVLGVARQLLGSDVYLHQARINMMPGFTGRGFYWHSDFETWHAEDGMPDPRAVSCSLALTENFTYNGSLLVIPGSHHMFYPCVGETPEQNHTTSLVEQTIGVPDQDTLTKATDMAGIDQFIGPAGTALWFDSNLLHGSGSNITPFPRSNVFLVFNSVENALTTPFAGTTPRPEYIAAREFAPLH